MRDWWWILDLAMAKRRYELDLGIIGGFVLFVYGIIPTFQSSRFHRIYAAYDGLRVQIPLPASCSEFLNAVDSWLK